MAKILKSILALGIAALLVFALAACNNKPDNPTDPPTTEITTDVTEEPTIDTAGTGDQPTTEAPTEVGGTTVEPTTVDPSATTLEVATTTKPTTQAEIIAYANTAMDKVRADKPGYSFTERTIIDDSKMTSSSGLIKTLGPPIIRFAKGMWGSWTDPSVKAKGADHNGVIPKVALQDGWVKSATINESGANYVIKITLKDERVATLPVDEKSTTIGKIAMAHTKGSIADGAAQAGVTINEFDALYTGCYIDLTIDKATGTVKKITAYTNAQISVEAKLAVTVDASLPLANESVYTF